MRIKRPRHLRGAPLALVASAIVLLSACSDAGTGDEGSGATSEREQNDSCYELGWKECPDEPYPFSTPLPPAEPTAIDGTYTRVIGEDIAGAPGKCRRCPPYRLEPGAETLTFDRGRFFVEHEPPGFRSSGHFRIDGGQLELFNDANCIEFEGIYEWDVSSEVLTLDAVEDECPFTRLRQRFLMIEEWRTAEAGTAGIAPECIPPSEEAAVTGHWPIPEECDSETKA